MTSFIEILNHWGNHFLNFAWPMIWQSSLLIAIIFALDLALRRKIRAAIRYALWLMVLVKLLLPPSLALPTGLAWWLLPSPKAPAKSQPAAYVVTYGDQVAPTFPLQLQPPSAPIRPKMSAAAWTLTASGAVSAGLLAWLLVRWRQINRKVRRAKTSEKLIPVLEEARRLARLRPGIRLKMTEDSMSPAVCGLLRPVILLPQSLVEKLSAGQLRAVLLHEAIHLRRGDVWVNCAQALLQIFYWWHPLLWLANARIRRVREEAVDDAVMLALRDDAEIYAPTLLEVAKLAFNRPLASLGLVGILESRSALRQRIERLVNFDAPRKAGLTLVSILGILAFSAVALPMGQAMEKTNEPAPISQPNDNGPAATNVVDSKIEADKLVQNGKLLYEKGNFREAETNFNQALKLDPNNQGAFYYLSLVQQANFAREEHNRTNQAANNIAEVAKAWSPKVGIGLPVPNPYVTNTEVHTSPGREMIFSKLNSLRLESISWSNGIPLSEVIRYLAEQSKLRDPDKKGINYLYNPSEAASPAAGGSRAGVGAPSLFNPTTGLLETPTAGAASKTVAPNTINVKLVMKDASMHDVLDAVMLAADRPIKYSIEDYAVVISPKPPEVEPPIFEMRVFKVDTNAFASGLRGVRNLQTNDVVTMAKSLFSQLGVDLSAPGRSIAINDRLGLLFVRATPSELDVVERVIQALNQTPPQIHIKARFIEVPKKGFVMPQALTNTVAGLMTGILSDSEFRTMLHSLEQRKGVEALAEPECVTTSGRQTQMRATDIEDIITNFTSNSTNVVPQIGKVEIGPTIDIIPYVLADGYTINLTAIPQLLEFLGYEKIPVPNKAGQKVSPPTVLPHFRTRQAVADVNLWDGQTLILGNLKDSSFVGGKEVKNRPTSDDTELLVFITASIVDPAGNRVHSDDEIRQLQEKTKSDIPPQPKLSTPSP